MVIILIYLWGHGNHKPEDEQKQINFSYNYLFVKILRFKCPKLIFSEVDEALAETSDAVQDDSP